MNTKICFLLFAVALFTCVGCATDPVAERQRDELQRARTRLFLQSHLQEFSEVRRNAEKAFGTSDQSKWTDAQLKAYIRALAAVIRKYQPSTPLPPTIVVQQQAAPYNPYIATGGVPPETFLQNNAPHYYGGTTTFRPNAVTGTGTMTFPDGNQATVTRNPVIGVVSVQNY